MSATIQKASEIEVGHHITATVFGFTLNIDTVYTTLIAGGIVVLLGVWVAAKSSVKNPSKVQLAWEAIVQEVTRQVEGALGRVNPFVVPLAITLFTFILLANWIELIPSGEHPKYLPAPTADVNLTYAMAILVIVGVHIHSFRQRGVKGYFGHYAQPYKVMLPLTILEEIVKPFTLALRLFGNIFAGGIMLAIIGLIPIWGFWGPNIMWKLFDMFIGLIQAFIFSLLTVIYFGIAGETHDAAHEESESAETETAEAEAMH
jgi:F-type H+-transporting ATPase subunit a